MAKTVIICGKLFDGLGDTMLGPTEILVEGDTIVEVFGFGRPPRRKRVIRRVRLFLCTNPTFRRGLTMSVHRGRPEDICSDQVLPMLTHCRPSKRS